MATVVYYSMCHESKAVYGSAYPSMLTTVSAVTSTCNACIGSQTVHIESFDRVAEISSPASRTSDRRHTYLGALDTQRLSCEEYTLRCAVTLGEEMSP